MSTDSVGLPDGVRSQSGDREGNLNLPCCFFAAAVCCGAAADILRLSVPGCGDYRYQVIPKWEAGMANFRIEVPSR